MAILLESAIFKINYYKFIGIIMEDYDYDDYEVNVLIIMMMKYSRMTMI